ELIFKPNGKRKIVVATNIAETSITVPGIRYVIDSGLARVPEYAPRLRTNRLPIVPVSKASADQRKGRCGRVMDGVCIRLYTKDDYFSREDFTLPEIRRSNLAGVILTMIAYSLGDIDTFPFLEPPSKQAVAEGYVQLRELGALDSNRNITDLGKKISRLPIDPHVAAMIIAARDEGALREVKVIAAALSIVDPRERPFEKRKEADAMHKRFSVPGSDPLSLVRLWDAYQDEWKTLKTQNKMRQFCAEHFLSFTRMREWHDVHQLIDEELKRMKGFIENGQPATADAVHRSLLRGLIGNCAYKNDKGKFRAARGREVVIFPGSALSGQLPAWISCHEIVETSQCFARGVFPIKVEWLEQIASHLVTRTYGDPWFDKETGFVRASERVTLYGMPVAEHSGVHYGKINPQKSTEVFIQEALVNEQMVSSAGFYSSNCALREEVETAESKMRSRCYFAGEDAVYQFYAQRLGTVTSLKELNDIIGLRGGDRFLYMKEEDIITGEIPESVISFPDQIKIGKKELPLRYTFEPGSEQDGVTLRCAAEDLNLMSQNALGWLLPALWPAKIEEILRNCPKEIRKKVIPLEDTAKILASMLKVSPKSFNQALCELLMKEYGIDITPDTCSEKKLPAHLSLKLEVCDKNGKKIAYGAAENVLNGIKSGAESCQDQWSTLTKKYELYELVSWGCGTIPEHIELVSPKNGLPMYGYPALYCNDKNTVDLRVFKTGSEAQLVHVVGVEKLLELAFTAEFAWLERELRMEQSLKLLCSAVGGAQKIQEQLFAMLKKHILQASLPLPRSQNEFEKIVDLKRNQIKGMGYSAISTLE
ncbi:MAG TPA: DUF3418 domain-containing protein, partial [Chitinispirillaceae bacterium]|nr:DUF3418 domain-containing protein [Chitinispirillaceae bacterium]